MPSAAGSPINPRHIVVWFAPKVIQDFFFPARLGGNVSGLNTQKKCESLPDNLEPVLTDDQFIWVFVSVCCNSGDSCGSSASWWAGVPPWGYQYSGSAPCTSLRSVLTTHWVRPQCTQRDDGGGAARGRLISHAGLERSQLDPSNQRGYKSQRSIWGRGNWNCAPVRTN